MTAAGDPIGQTPLPCLVYHHLVVVYDHFVVVVYYLVHPHSHRQLPQTVVFWGEVIEWVWSGVGGRG